MIDYGLYTRLKPSFSLFPSAP